MHHKVHHLKEQPVAQAGEEVARSYCQHCAERAGQDTVVGRKQAICTTCDMVAVPHDLDLSIDHIYVSFSEPSALIFNQSVKSSIFFQVTQKIPTQTYCSPSLCIIKSPLYIKS